MTEAQIRELGPELRRHLARYAPHLGGTAVRRHIDVYSRGLLSDMDRKTVEPIALAAGATVRSLQLLLTQHDWDERGLVDAMQGAIAEDHLPVPGQRSRRGIGVIGWIDETSAAKKGDKTPGVQRQYCGSTGKIDNCIITVHTAISHGAFSCIIDSDLYVPQSWIDDPDRCEEAGIPADRPFLTKPQIALQQVKRALGNGIRFDFLGFDEAYGGNPKFLLGLEKLGVTFIGEVPKTFHCFSVPPRYNSLQRPYVAKEAQNLANGGKAFRGAKWKTHQVRHKTVADSRWLVKAGRVYISVAGVCHIRPYWLIVARNPGTDEVKYFISNAPLRTPLNRLLKAAFSRWGIEHLFRVAKSEIGLTHFEGRRYRGLMRHMILCQLILLFVTEQAARLRGEKSAHHKGTGGPGAERVVPSVA